MNKNIKYLTFFSILAGFIFIGQSALATVGEACGVSGEGLCKPVLAGCDSIYDNIISDSKHCSEKDQKEQCCVPTKCTANYDGIGECRQSAASCREYETINKNTSDCLPPKSCCIMPKIYETTCPNGVCSGGDNVLEGTLSAVCAGGFTSDFCQEYASSCPQGSNSSNSLMCQQTLINLTNNGTVLVCTGSSQFANCLKSVTACLQYQNSSDCQQFQSQGAAACSQDASSSKCQQFQAQQGYVACSKDKNSSDCQQFQAQGSVACSQDQNSSKCQGFQDQQGAAACSQNKTSSDCQRFLAKKGAESCSQDSTSSKCQQYHTQGAAACLQDPSSSKCQEYKSQGAAACSEDKNSSECQQYSSAKNEGLVPCTGFDCTLCSVFELIKRIINWLVGFILSIAVGFVVYAGILMMFSGGDSGKITKAKETATTAVYGVALALGGWLIIGTLLGILTGSEKIMPWNEITCKSETMELGTKVETLSASCNSKGGTCQKKSLSCDGKINTDVSCSGTDMTCCVPTCDSAKYKGKCQDKNTTTCAGTYTPGLCAGSTNIQCCVPNSSSKPTVPTCSRGTLTNIQSIGMMYCKLGEPLNTGGTPTICPDELGIAFKRADGTIDGCGEAVQNKPL